MKRYNPLTVIICVATCASAVGQVYDNTANPANAINPLLPQAQVNSAEHGSRVSLIDGVDRHFNYLAFRLRSYGQGVSQFQYRVRFYAQDGLEGLPGSQLYDSGWRNGLIDSGADLTYIVAMQSVLLPSTFTWTVQLRNRTGNGGAIGPSLYGPPAIGQAQTGYWRRPDGGSWEYVDNGDPAFGAVVYADSIPGDTNYDCDVDLSDLATLLSNFGRSDVYGPPYGDTQYDGDVDIADLAVLLGWFGARCP